MQVILPYESRIKRNPGGSDQWPKFAHKAPNILTDRPIIMSDS
jgi:hypothetical protein